MLNEVAEANHLQRLFALTSLIFYYKGLKIQKTNFFSGF